jgi:hypothetical protein
MQRASESPPTQLTVNQAAGEAVNVAAAAAGQSEPLSLPRHLMTCSSMTTTDISTTELGGQVGLPAS